MQTYLQQEGDLDQDEGKQCVQELKLLILCFLQVRDWANSA